MSVCESRRQKFDLGLHGSEKSDGVEECHISMAGQEKMDEKLNATPATFDPFLSEDQQIGTSQGLKRSPNFSPSNQMAKSFEQRPKK